MENMLCPKDLKTRRHTHRHVLYTNEFCELLSEFLPPDLNPNKVANLASFHHEPDSPLQQIIRDADILSAAMERVLDETDMVGSGTSFRRVHLRSIARQILQKQAETDWTFDFTPLDGDLKVIVPHEIVEEKEDLIDQYRILWDGMLAAWKKNLLQDPWQYINRALAILEPFTWCVPSATNVRPDISLFDHLKTTSAVAGCLYHCQKMDNPFLLVVGDYGGIQNYLYDLSHGAGKVAKSLRGRSFYVRMLAECVSLKILQATGCPATHRIMQAGGRFYLLLPNLDSTRRILESATYDLDRWILTRKNAELRFTLGWIEVARYDIWDPAERVSRFPVVKERVDAVLAQEKQRPLRRMLYPPQESWLLPKVELNEDQALCKSCRRNSATSVLEEGEVRFICPSCQRDRLDGGKLTGAESVAIIETSSPGVRLPFFDYELLDGSRYEIQNAVGVLSFEGGKAAKSNTPLLPFRQARQVPRDAAGEILEFEKIAASAQGRKALGYLKADVDNLGYIFTQGFKKVKIAGEEVAKSDEASISRLSTLSRMLELFFTSYFEQFLREKYPDVYLVYSGGDDLLAIGPWNRMFDLVLDLRRKFREFTCRNPNWGLSAGICIVNPRTPVLQAVNMADACLERSKDIAGKDACTAFDTTLKWKDYETTLNQARNVLTWLQDEVLNAGKVRRLLTYAELYRNRNEYADKNAYLRYVSQLIYDLKRNWKSSEINDSPEEIASLKWAQSLANPVGNEIKQLYFICQYALNGVRD